MCDQVPDHALDGNADGELGGGTLRSPQEPGHSDATESGANRDDPSRRLGADETP